MTRRPACPTRTRVDERDHRGRRHAEDVGKPQRHTDTYNSGSSPFNGILFYQRRRNVAVPILTGNGTDVKLTGTIYAKWANFDLSGQGTYNAQFVVGSLQLSGNGLVTIHATGKNFGTANLVFLVE